MKCINCDAEMKVITVNDDPTRGFAYNVYECNECMIICKSNV